MLPISVEARAKMKITLGQLEELPDSSSLRVLESWRVSISATFSMGAAAGRAATKPAAARSWRNFMLAVGWFVKPLRTNWKREDVVEARAGSRWLSDELERSRRGRKSSSTYTPEVELPSSNTPRSQLIPRIAKL